MREAIGGSWLLGIVLVFIVLFSAFLAVSINYSRAFNVKNQVLSYIERNEGFSTTYDETASCTDKSTQCQVQKYLRRVNYSISDQVVCPEIFNDSHGRRTYSNPGGYCIKKVCTSGGNYYTVATFVRIELPILWDAFTIPITGETMNIFYDSSDMPCS